MRDELDELLEKTFHDDGKPDDSVNQAVLKKVKEYENMKADKNKSKTLIANGKRGAVKAAAVVAGIILTGSSAAYAAVNYFGLDYFAEKHGGAGLNDAAHDIMDTEPKTDVTEQTKGYDLLKYDVKEVLCDRNYVLATVNVSIKENGDYLLISNPTDPDMPISTLNIGINSEQSIRAYCDENGIIPIFVNLNFDANTAESKIRRVMTDDEQEETDKLTAIIVAERMTDEKSFDATMQASVIYDMGGKKQTSYQDDRFNVHIEDHSTDESVAYTMSDTDAAKHMDLDIQNIELTTTEVATYLKVNYESSVSSEDATEEFIQLCDKDGNLIPSSILSMGNCRLNPDGSYTCTSCYDNIGLPETIYLSLGDGAAIVKIQKDN